MADARMPRRVRVGLAVAAGAALFVAGLWTSMGGAFETRPAQTTAFRATLSARAEVPRPTGVPAGATGVFTATLVRRASGGTLSFRLTFRGLSGRAAAAHVHLAKAGRAGPVSVALCGPCKSGARGTARANARTVRALLAGGAYVNVHTARNPAGEIRGQVRRGGTAGTTQPPTAPTTTTTTYPIDDPYP